MPWDGIGLFISVMRNDIILDNGPYDCYNIVKY